MTVLEKIKRCVSLVWDFQEIYSEEDIEVLEKENAELKEQLIKAKELLNGCIFKARGNVNPSWSELITDIEQLLREIDVDNVIQEIDKGCHDVLCEECMKEDCTVRKLGLVPTKEIEK